MRKLTTLIRHNLSRAKGQYISFSIIIVITAIILNTAFVLAGQTFKAYDARFEQLNTADINVTIPAQYELDTDKIRSLSGVDDVEMHSALMTPVTIHDFANSDFEMNALIYDVSKDKDINRFEIDGSGPGLYIPSFISEFGQFEPGDSMDITIDGKTYHWIVAGIVDEMQFGNYGTGQIGLFASHDLYNKLSAPAAVEYSLKTDGSLQSVKNEVTALLESEQIPVLSLTDRAATRQTRTMVATLLIIIFIAIAGLVLAVSLILTGFRIRMSISDEMTQMGVLKAIGYDSNMIIESVVIPYVGCALISSLIGTALSYLMLPSLADILAIQSGFHFTPKFDWTALVCAASVLTLSVLVFSLISARRIRKLEPIDALRTQTMKAPKGQNILLAALTVGITILLCFASSLAYNVSVTPENFMSTLSEESPTVIATASDGSLDELKSAVENMEGVDTALIYQIANVSGADDSLKAFITPDYSQTMNDICYDGRNPAAADECAVGSALSDKYPIGSTIALKYDSHKADYVVTGYIQSVNNAGKAVELTVDGARRLSIPISTLNIYTDNVDVPEFIASLEKDHGALIETTINYEQLEKSSQSLYSQIVSAIVISLFVFSALLTLLVLYIVIRSMITRRKQEFGILKAVGYTSRQLAVKLTKQIMPVIAAASIVTALLAPLWLPYMNSALFAGIGAYKNNFETSMSAAILASLLFALTALMISWQLMRPIRKINVCSLLKGE